MANTQQPTIYVLGIVFPIIAIVAVILRFQSRHIRGQQLGSDDWTILVALILGIGVTVDILIMTGAGGLGAHTQLIDDGEPLNPGALLVFAKALYALEILTWPAVGMNKISVLLLYKRIFSTPRFTILVWVLIGVVIAWTIAFTFAMMFSCIPIASQWTFHITFYCVDLWALFATALVTDVATDALILLLPIYKVWQLQMPTSRKLMIMIIFLLGGLVSVVGIVRIQFLAPIYGILSEFPLGDSTWVYSQAFYWTIIETNVGVLSACLPTLSPILERLSWKTIYLKIKTSITSFRTSTEKISEIRLGSMEEGLNSTGKQPIDDQSGELQSSNIKENE